MNDDPRSVGMIGLGLLGTALAERLLADGWNLVGFDIAADARERLSRLGGAPADTARQVAQCCRRLLLSLPNSDVVADVLREMEPCLAPGSLVIDTTTGSPEFAVETSMRLARWGAAYVDATVVGSSELCRAGQAVLLVGGDAAAVAEASPLVAALGRKTYVLGASGSGARMKLIVNHVLGLNRAVLAEALSLARACGVDPRQALEVLSDGPAASAVMPIKGPKMLAEEFAPQARLAQHRKDVRLIRALAEQHRAAVPLEDVHERLLDRAIERGFGDSDNSAIIKAFEAG